MVPHPERERRVMGCSGGGEMMCEAKDSHWENTTCTITNTMDIERINTLLLY
jgi:hypothetical protein